ncbi:GCR1-dependent translation factor 1 [Malassezia sp. CBS 17886]|nr:GCR1-dependent translation factor 1 [Malassezia sp. CBS 17886]
MNTTAAASAAAAPSATLVGADMAGVSATRLVGTSLAREDLYGLGKSFAITVVSELGDKTFLTSAILAMRHPPVTVFWGSWSAMICMSVLSSLLGAVLPQLLSRSGSLLLSAALFLGFGVLMLWHAIHAKGHEIKEEWKEAQDEICANDEEHELEGMETGVYDHANVYPNATPYPAPAKRRSVRAFVCEGTRNLVALFVSPVFSQAFVLSFIGEWGDRSQVATMALAATHRVSVVVLGTSMAHLACVALAVSVGALLAARLSVKHITLGSAFLFFVFGAVSAYEALAAGGRLRG